MKRLYWLLILLLIYSCKKDGDDEVTIDYSNRSAGVSAHDLLSNDRYQSVHIEIQYMPGYEPEAAAISNVISFLGSVSNKPGGISHTIKAIGSAADDTLSLEEVRTVENRNRTNFTSGNTLQVYILVTDAVYTDGDVLGIAHKNTSIALFGKTIFRYSGGFGQVSRVAMESTVLEHEIGHLLGLVNLGSAMQVNHEDPDHPKHCNNDKCLMYYASESFAPGLAGNNIPVLDDNCRNDLRANGGK